MQYAFRTMALVVVQWRCAPVMTACISPWRQFIPVGSRHSDLAVTAGVEKMKGINCAAASRVSLSSHGVGLCAAGSRNATTICKTRIASRKKIIPTP